MPSRARLDGRMRDTLVPSISTWPPLGGSSPVMTLNSVVLPAPFGPIRPVTSPGSAERLTPSSATLPPKRTVTSRTSSDGAPASDAAARSGAHRAAPLRSPRAGGRARCTSSSCHGSVTPTHSSGTVCGCGPRAARCCASRSARRDAQQPAETPHAGEDHVRPVLVDVGDAQQPDHDLAADDRGEDPLVASTPGRTRRAGRRSRRWGCGRARCRRGRAAAPARLAKNGPIWLMQRQAGLERDAREQRRFRRRPCRRRPPRAAPEGR